MKFLRVGSINQEKPAIIDNNGSIRDISSLIQDLNNKTINDDLIESINKIAPFGIGNPKPNFLFHNVKVIKPKLIGESNKHLSFFIIDETNKVIKSIIFNCSDNKLGETILSCYKKNLFSFIGFIKKSIWKNKTYFEIIIEDGVLGKVII